MEAAPFKIEIDTLCDSVRQELVLTEESGELLQLPERKDEEEVVFKNPHAPPQTEYCGPRTQSGMPDKRTKKGKAWHKAREEQNTQIYDI